MIRLKSVNRTPWVRCKKNKPFERDFKDYFYWEGLPDKYVAYRAYFELVSKEVFCGNQLVARVIKPTEWIYRGHKVEFTFSITPIYKKVWKCKSFGKLTILYYSGFYSVYLNGTKVGKYRSIKNPICDFFYRRNYVKRCLKRNVTPVEKPNRYFIELDDNNIDPLLALLLVIYVHTDEIEID